MKNSQLPDKLKENITNIFGERGKKWLDNLNIIVEKLAAHWQLISITPVDNMTFNYVAKGMLKNQPIVLKISCDETSYLDEKKVLAYFNGNASIKLIDYHPQYYALLLQQAIPGTTLKSLYPRQTELVMDAYSQIIKKLHSKAAPLEHDFRHINDWLKIIDNVASDKIPKELLDKARYLKKTLLSSSSRQFVLHGDLHHNNVLKHGDSWLIIDPKGIVGEEEFEIAAFDFITHEELENREDIQKLFHTRAKILAEKSGLSHQRIKDWVFVRLILSAIWSIEDNGDPGWAIKLAKIIAQVSS